MEMERPCIAFASCYESGESKSVERLLVQLLGSGGSSVPSVSKELTEDVLAYDLTLDTKYYTAEVRLCWIKGRKLGDETFAGAVDAVILHFDGKKFSDVQLWDSYLTNWNAETKILVCDQLLDSNAESWSIKHGFEVVELNPTPDSRIELQDYGEVFGVERILQILKARSWANARMKDGGDSANIKQEIKLKKSEARAGISDSGMEETAEQFSERCTLFDDCGKGENLAQKELDELVFKAVDSGDDPGRVSFEELFAQFETMKNRAKQMPETERKAYAQKITLAFWKAIGGDEDEVFGLSDSD